MLCHSWMRPISWLGRNTGLSPVSKTFERRSWILVPVLNSYDPETRSAFALFRSLTLIMGRIQWTWGGERYEIVELSAGSDPTRPTQITRKDDNTAPMIGRSTEHSMLQYYDVMEKAKANLNTVEWEAAPIGESRNLVIRLVRLKKQRRDKSFIRSSLALDCISCCVL